MEFSFHFFGGTDSNFGAIRCSLTFPLTVAQIVVGHSAWMHFWEIHFSVDYAAAIETKIELPFENTDETMELRLTYDLDGSLYMTNGSSQIWHVSLVHRMNSSDIYMQ